MGKLGSLLKKAMVISAEDQVSYCNQTVQVGPHVLVVTCARMDSNVPRLRNKHFKWMVRHGGHIISRATESLSSFLTSSKLAERRRVLELGAGMGVCGLIAHKTGADVVALTDGDSTAMRHLRENITINVGSAGEGKMDEAKTESEEGEGRLAHARVLKWGDVAEVRQLMEVLETGHFDLVIGSDVIYPESLNGEEALRMMDVKARDLMATAAAALREGGTFLLAHEVRGDMMQVLKILETHAIASGFGPPQAVRMEDSPERFVLSLEFYGKVDQRAAAEKSEGADDAAGGWQELATCLSATGFGSSARAKAW